MEDLDMVMTATVIQVDSGSLLVTDSSNGQEVRVIFRNARRFSPGDSVRITYNGAMTLSIPPQIAATSIQRIPSFAGPTPPSQTTPAETRAIILQRRQNALLVREINTNRQLLVIFAQAHHFCVGQRITVQYDTIVMSNPPEITATDITPIC